MTYTIAGTTYPDAEHAAAAYSEAYDLDEFGDMFPNGERDVLPWLRFQHPYLSDADRDTLTQAMLAHATRKDQHIPSRASLMTYLQRATTYTEPGRPAHDGLLCLPDALREPPRPRSWVRRLLAVFSFANA